MKVLVEEKVVAASLMKRTRQSREQQKLTFNRLNCIQNLFHPCLVLVLLIQ